MSTLAEFRQALAELAVRAIDLKARRDAAFADRSAFLQTQEPQRPRVVEDVQIWFEYRRAAQAHAARKQELEQQTDEADAAWKELVAEARKLLPELVWFRVGDHAIGLSYTNWGGSQYDLEIEPWSDKLPSLDRRYRGD